MSESNARPVARADAGHDVEIILYSQKYDEFALLNFFGMGVAFSCSDEFVPIIKEIMRDGTGFVYSDDWIFVGDL